ncbi:ribosomal RNA small subunit methyltransferase A [Prauserella oleivorans]|uniref:Ribosomal RNA small subunit methyltransferase A n=1 Tax=Prauserella oleivorans TaxID=1478153 RepID=A0ABW5WGA4_9PSEU
MPRHGYRPARRPPNPSGVHFLASGHVADRLVAACAPGPADLVLDLGAGFGAITAHLARTGATVVAVERDPEFARKLRNRFGDRSTVRVVVADMRTFPLPRKPFVVASSIPYSISTPLLRRLVHSRHTQLDRAALLVEWGFAKRVTAIAPRSRDLAWWAARYELRIDRRVPARCFRPAPTMDSALLTITRRTGLPRAAEHTLRALLDAAYRTPDRSVRSVVAGYTGNRSRAVFRATGIAPAAPAGTLPPADWAALAAAVHDSQASTR